MLLFAVSVVGAAASPSPQEHAQEALDVLQRNFYHPLSGLWDCPLLGGVNGDTGSSWNCANTLEAALNTISFAGNDTYKGLVSRAWMDTAIAYPIHRATDGIDDMEWWGLAWARAHEVAADEDYLKRAKGFFAEATKYWDEGTCGGGVWWDRKRTYKNAITNELFFTLASRLHALTADEVYLDWSRKSWQWLNQSGLVNRDGLINDGLTLDCKNNGGETWTYNQGVVLGGLLHLYQVDSSELYLDAACSIADATLVGKVTDGVLRESCEPGCNHDGRQFKGIFVRYLAYLADALPDSRADQKARYAAFVALNAATAWEHRNAAGQFTESWGEVASVADAISHSSGLDLMNADLLLAPPPYRSGPALLYPDQSMSADLDRLMNADLLLSLAQAQALVF
jgi:hypothetical protein